MSLPRYVIVRGSFPDVGRSCTNTYFASGYLTLRQQSRIYQTLLNFLRPFARPGSPSSERNTLHKTTGKRKKIKKLKHPDKFAAVKKKVLNRKKKEKKKKKEKRKKNAPDTKPGPIDIDCTTKKERSISLFGLLLVISCTPHRRF